MNFQEYFALIAVVALTPDVPINYVYLYLRVYYLIITRLNYSHDYMIIIILNKMYNYILFLILDFFI